MMLSRTKGSIPASEARSAVQAVLHAWRLFRNNSSRSYTLVMSQDELLSLVRAHSGHFVHESGHHGDVWWDLEGLCHKPAALMPFVAALAARVREYQPEVICGSLVEGAFV